MTMSTQGKKVKNYDKENGSMFKLRPESSMKGTINRIRSSDSGLSVGSMDERSSINVCSYALKDQSVNYTKATKEKRKRMIQT